MNKANKYITNTPRSTTRATPSNKSYYQKGKEGLGKNLRANQSPPQDIPQRTPKRLQRNRGSFEDVLDYSLNQYSYQISKNSPKHSSESLAKKYAKDYSKKNSKQSVRDVPKQPQKKTSDHSSGLYQRNTSKRRDNYVNRSDYVPKKSYEGRSNKDYSTKPSRKPPEKFHENYSNRQSRLKPRQIRDNHQENFFESPENVVNPDSEYYLEGFSEEYQERFSEQYSEQQPRKPYYEDSYEGYSNEPYEDEYFEDELGQAQEYTEQYQDHVGQYQENSGQYQEYTGQYPDPEQQQEQYQGYSEGYQEEYPEMYPRQSEQYPEQFQEDYYGYDQIPENAYQQKTYDSDLGKGKGALRKVLSLSKFSKNSSGISLKYAGFAVFLVICLSILCFFQYPGSVLEVSGASMEPKFHSGDRIFASQWIGNINRFDIVVVSNENTENLSSDSGWIKRVIGLPGETIKYKNGNLYVNGKKIKQSFVSDNNSWFIGTEDFGPVTLGDDEYWVMGDNRSNSCDSRYVGAFKRDDIKYVYHFTIKELSDKDSN